jgi:hypothetical protein
MNRKIEDIIVAIILSAVLFFSFYQDFRKEVPKHLGLLSLFIPFTTGVAIICCILLVSVKTFRERISYTIFSFFLFLGFTIFILAFYWQYKESYILIFFIFNLILTIFTGHLFYKKLKNSNPAKPE